MTRRIRVTRICRVTNDHAVEHIANRSHQNRSHQNRSHQNRSHQNRSYQNRSHQGFASNPLSHP